MEKQLSYREYCLLHNMVQTDLLRAFEFARMNKKYMTENELKELEIARQHIEKLNEMINNRYTNN